MLLNLRISFPIKKICSSIFYLLVNCVNKGNNKITELRTILQRESQLIRIYKQTKSVNNRKTVKTVMTLTWYRHSPVNSQEETIHLSCAIY